MSELNPFTRDISARSDISRCSGCSTGLCVLFFVVIAPPQVIHAKLDNLLERIGSAGSSVKGNDKQEAEHIEKFRAKTGA